MLGETKYLGSDVSGTPNDTVTFTDNQRATTTSGGWAAIENSTLLDAHPCRYRRQFLAPNFNRNFQIWTEPLASTSCSPEEKR